jgi:hypothetical protein
LPVELRDDIEGRCGCHLSLPLVANNVLSAEY